MAIKRQKAVKCTVSDILGGEYVVQEGWNPNFISSDRGKISRANIMGAVVNVIDTHTLILDDGTGQLSCRAFDKELPDIQAGEIILAIGRPRQFNQELFLLPEIIKPIIDRKWVELRKLELKLKLPEPKEETQVPEKKEKKKEEPMKEKVATEKAPTNKADDLMDLIREKDSGEGAEIEEVVKEATFDDAEKVLNKLLEEGHIFTIKAGKVKVLE